MMMIFSLLCESHHGWTGKDTDSPVGSRCLARALQQDEFVLSHVLVLVLQLKEEPLYWIRTDTYHRNDLTCLSAQSLEVFECLSVLLTFCLCWSRFGISPVWKITNKVSRVFHCKDLSHLVCQPWPSGKCKPLHVLPKLLSPFGKKIWLCFCCHRSFFWSV